jgi:hypothetical protein
MEGAETTLRHEHERLLPCRLDPLPRYLSPVEASEGSSNLVSSLLNLDVRSGEDNLHVRGVALVRVNTTVGTVRAATRFLKSVAVSLRPPKKKPCDARGLAGQRCF